MPAFHPSFLLLGVLAFSSARSATADLLDAVHRDDSGAALRLLAEGADPRAANRYGVTPLAAACLNGNAGLVDALLEAGADPDATQAGGETALMTAARTGRPEPVRLLLAAGARADATEGSGQTALMWAAAEGHAAVVALLIEGGADPRRRLGSGFDALLFAARAGRIDVVRELLEAGVDVGAATTGKRENATAPPTGTSALTIAVENGHFELAAWLLEAGADPNDQRSGFTPLHILTRVRKPNRGDDLDGLPPPAGSGILTSLALADLLITRGADVNARLERGPTGGGQLGMPGATPLLLASKTADLQFIELLVRHGADPTIPNSEGATPLMAAAGLGTRAPTEEAGTEAEAIAAAEFLFGLGADVDAVSKTGETAMHGAAYKSLPGMVRLLAARGATIGVWNRKNRSGWTPLLIAQGFRPGNFKPSVETIDALSEVMRAQGIEPPPPPERRVPGKPERYP